MTVTFWAEVRRPILPSTSTLLVTVRGGEGSHFARTVEFFILFPLLFPLRDFFSRFERIREKMVVPDGAFLR